MSPGLATGADQPFPPGRDDDDGLAEIDRQLGRSRAVLAGFLGGAAVMLVVVVVLVLVFWRAVAAGLLRDGAEGHASELPVPAQEREIARAELTHWVNEFEASNITFPQLLRAWSRVAESPFIAFAVARVMHESVIEPAGLSPEQREAARAEAQRVSWAISLGEFNQETLLACLGPLAVESEFPKGRPVADADEFLLQGRWFRVGLPTNPEAAREKVVAMTECLAARLDARGLPRRPYIEDLAAYIRRDVELELGLGYQSQIDAANPDPSGG